MRETREQKKDGERTAPTWRAEAGPGHGSVLGRVQNHQGLSVARAEAKKKSKAEQKPDR